MENEFLDRAQLDEVNAANEKTKTKKKKSSQKKKTKSNRTSAFVQILNGDFLSKEFILNNLSFIFFIMLLLLVLISKGYYGKHLTNNVVKTQKELDEITSDYFELKAKLEENTQRSILLEKLEPAGLKETVNPTKVIRIKKEKKKDE